MPIHDDTNFLGKQDLWMSGVAALPSKCEPSLKIIKNWVNSINCWQ